MIIESATTVLLGAKATLDVAAAVISTSTRWTAVADARLLPHAARRWMPSSALLRPAVAFDVQYAALEL
jgi:hypothetical protein